MSGFNVCNRYLVVLYYQANKVSLVDEVLRCPTTRNSNLAPQVYQRLDSDKAREKLEEVKEKFGVGVGSQRITKDEMTPLRTPAHK